MSVGTNLVMVCGHEGFLVVPKSDEYHGLYP